MLENYLNARKKVMLKRAGEGYIPALDHATFELLENLDDTLTSMGINSDTKSDPDRLSMQCPDTHINEMCVWHGA